MVYYFSRFLVRLALPLYLRRLFFYDKKNVPDEGPVLLASNHPGSFFDAVIVGSILKKPINTLTRGDVFKNPKAAFWLRQIKLIPVFRGSEGRENLRRNDATLTESFKALEKNEALMIFSEGLCVHEWNLRPLGKGTARIAYQAWYNNPATQTMPVVPVGLTYEHFRGTNKRVVVRFGPPILPSQLSSDPSDYEKWLREFNAILRDRMVNTILEVPNDLPIPEQKQRVEQYFTGYPCYATNAPLRFIGQIGRALHRPLYRFFEKKVAKMTGKSVFYDSILFGLLLYLYPVLVVALALITGCLTNTVAGIAVFFILPLLALLGNRYR